MARERDTANRHAPRNSPTKQEFHNGVTKLKSYLQENEIDWITDFSGANWEANNCTTIGSVSSRKLGEVGKWRR